VNVLAKFVVALCLSAAPIAAPVQAPDHVRPVAARQGGGKWYLAESGHAVYCYGPVLLVRQPEGGLSRVATFCKGDKIIVPLKD
jgi:hypothetical protein